MLSNLLRVTQEETESGELVDGPTDHDGEHDPGCWCPVRGVQAQRMRGRSRWRRRN